MVLVIFFISSNINFFNRYYFIINNKYEDSFDIVKS